MPLIRLCALILAQLVVLAGWSFAQSADAAETAETIRGKVLNSASHEPIAGALVASPDNRFATRTDSQGRFEFTLPKAEHAESPAPETAGPPPTPQELSPEVFTISNGILAKSESGRPFMLSAKKPGFLENSNLSALDLSQHAKEITLFLVPEAVIAGHVSLPSSEAPDRIQLQLFRRIVQNGVAQWVRSGGTTSRSNGNFRFADLPPGTYKLLTVELLDHDPLSSGPRQQLYGYPPVYYPNADDFSSATEIVLSPGEVAEPHLTLAKQPYYRVRIAIANPQTGRGAMNVNVASQKGHAGPGYTLTYNYSTQQIEGVLPSGTYMIEVRSFGQTAAGVMTLVVKDAPVTDAKITLQPAASLAVEVKEEFNGKTPKSLGTVGPDGRRFQLRGPRRYLNVFLESADEFSALPKTGFLRPPAGPDDMSLDIEDVLPGRYWVRVSSSYGYAASIRSGSTDLLREPLLVGAGASTPIEITMRDDSSHIDGQVEGVSPDSPPPVRGLPPAFVYCVPTQESTGQFVEIGVSPDGTFTSQPLAPGEYRVLAFDRQQAELEYRNPEAMKLYDGRGSIVQVAGGQSEHVNLQLIPSLE